jgi:ADP-heptose:LPS heptosyltransferase
MIPTNEIHRVVVPVVAGIGNALLACPLLRQLKRGIPRAYLTVLAGNAPMGEVCRRQPGVDEVVVCSGGGSKRLVAEARSRRPDLYVIPFPSNRWQYNALQITSRARYRLMHGYDVGRVKAASFMPAVRVPAERGLHDVVQNLRLLRALGLDPDDSEAPSFPITDADRSIAEQMLRDVGAIDPGTGTQRPFVVMHAGSAQTVLAAAKRWPVDRYADLIEAIVTTIGIDVVLVEGPDERGVADGITAELSDSVRRWDASKGEPGVSAASSNVFRVIRLTGPIGAGAALLSRACAYVGTDSGLAHLAAAVGTPAVTLFAPADPDRVCPFGYRHLVVQAERACAPCMKYPFAACRPGTQCRPPMCIESITVDRVIASVRRALESR